MESTSYLVNPRSTSLIEVVLHVKANSGILAHRSEGKGGVVATDLLSKSLALLIIAGKEIQQFRRRALQKRKRDLSRVAASAKQRHGKCGFAELLCIPVQCGAERALNCHGSQIQNLDIIPVKWTTGRW